MRIANTYVDVEDLLERLEIEVLYERGEWADCLCPLHDESRPSFSMNLEEGVWICRHGGETGDMIGLVARLVGLTRREAIQWISDTPVPTASSIDVLEKLYKTGKTEEPVTNIRDWVERYDALNELIMSEYWFERGFTERTMLHFGVRYDHVDNSIIIPIRDENANVTGFIKRFVPPLHDKKKYDYPLGMKRTLFPLDRWEGDEVILVEGGLDALWLHQHGHIEALAVLGSSVTDEQAKWIKKNVSRVILLFDNDEAGKEGSAKAAKKLRGLTTLVATIPDGAKDIQDLTEPTISEVIRNASLALFPMKGGTV